MHTLHPPPKTSDRARTPEPVVEVHDVKDVQPEVREVNRRFTKLNRTFTKLNQIFTRSRLRITRKMLNQSWR